MRHIWWSVAGLLYCIGTDGADSADSSDSALNSVTGNSVLWRSAASCGHWMDPILYRSRGGSDGGAKNQLGERRLGELFFGQQTIGRQARTVRRQQIGRLGDIFQTVGQNVWNKIRSYDRCAVWLEMKTECTTFEKYDQSIRLGAPVMGRLVSIKRNVNWPGLVKRSQEDLSPFCRRLSSHYKTKALAKTKTPGTDGVW